MKIVFTKLILDGSNMVVLPRAEFAPEDSATLAQIKVDLGRVASGNCVYPLASLEAHDHHAPGWNADGTGRGSDPSATVQTYMDRIIGEIKSKAPDLTFEVEVKEQVLEAPTGPAAGSDGGNGNGSDGGKKWDQYLPPGEQN